MNEDKLAQDLKKITLKAGKAVMSHYGNAKIQYYKKHVTDIVTQADIASNKVITTFIKKNYPTHGIISEEEKDYQRDAEYVWIIDPIDGTRNFSSKLPHFSVLVAIAKNNKVIMGAICQPFFKELYFARQGKGAYLNKKKIHCSSAKSIERSIGVIDISFRNAATREKTKRMILAEEKTGYWVTELTCIGSNALIVADGRRDWLCQPKVGGVWDLAAPYIILKESGCKVTNFQGKEWTLNDGDMIAANPLLHKKILAIMNKK